MPGILLSNSLGSSNSAELVKDIKAKPFLLFLGLSGCQVPGYLIFAELRSYRNLYLHFNISLFANVKLHLECLGIVLPSICDQIKVVPGESSYLIVDVVNFRKPLNSLALCQTVRVDERDGLVFSTQAFRPWRNMESPLTEVIVPTCGDAMTKLFRSVLPKHCVRLRRMWSWALSGGFTDMRATVCVCCAV